MNDEALTLLRALLADDTPAALASVERCRNAGLSRSEVLERVLVPALATLGEQWAQGAVSDDAFASAGVAADQVIAFAAPPEVALDTGITVVVGTPLGDGHAGLGKIVASTLAVAGHRVIDLGDEVPELAFVEAASAGSVTAVLVCVSDTRGLTGLARTTAALAEAQAAGPAVMAVGPAAAADPSGAAAAGATYVARDASRPWPPWPRSGARSSAGGA